MLTSIVISLDVMISLSNETNMIKRIDQQFKVTYIMIDYMTQFNLSK